MKIFRVEHPVTARGPYSAGVMHADSEKICECGEGDAFICWSECPLAVIYRLSNEIGWAHGFDHPTPRAEGLDMTEDDLCGFLYMEDLHDWFYGFMTLLAGAGYMVATYEASADDIQLGDRQIIFRSGNRLTYSEI